eukprot:CAMPEP_0118912036 /NCGR_PEP_ID=MMETSP1166-20130328/13467_1 /TAXON_ID=1104430 /ORGANISM="Chrysoreinhardia sp, Strain CCMP3193" /LENGTH=47 /DNA_ID= /DNA_START= /DNA_END= /DNA_ORIENTATION=
MRRRSCGSSTTRTPRHVLHDSQLLRKGPGGRRGTRGRVPYDGIMRRR